MDCLELDIINDPDKYGYKNMSCDSDGHNCICIFVWHTSIENEIYHWNNILGHQREGVGLEIFFDESLNLSELDLEKII